MDDRKLVFEDFADKVGQIFTITFDDAPGIAITLTEAELLKTGQLPPSGRPSFSLIFVGDTPQMLPQRIYRVEQEALGQIELFMVPVGKKPEGFEYQALFN
jgi:Domain of unknown function (DUF6916)